MYMYIHVVTCMYDVVHVHHFSLSVLQARTKGLLWKTKVLEKKKATMLNISGPQDSVNRTIIDGATVSHIPYIYVLLYLICIYMYVSCMYIIYHWWS